MVPPAKSAYHGMNGRKANEPKIRILASVLLDLDIMERV